MNVLKIYTDGACSGNPGKGGWGVVMLYGDTSKELSGGENMTTNNRMEMSAVVEGLKAVKRTDGLKIEVYSDSAYVVNAVNQGWIANWQRNGWRTSDKREVLNRDLWEQIIELNKKYRPAYIKVKGHSDNQYNNRADELAVAAAKAMR